MAPSPDRLRILHLGANLAAKHQQYCILIPECRDDRFGFIDLLVDASQDGNYYWEH